jgi:hypothetical protein
MYVCMYVYIYVYVCVCLIVFMFVSMYFCMYVCMYVLCMYACMYACMHVCMYVCMHVCMYACMYVCMTYIHTHCTRQVVVWAAIRGRAAEGSKTLLLVQGREPDKKIEGFLPPFFQDPSILNRRFPTPLFSRQQCPSERWPAHLYVLMYIYMYWCQQGTTGQAKVQSLACPVQSFACPVVPCWHQYI